MHRLTAMDRGAIAALRLLARGQTVSEGENEWETDVDDIENAIRAGGIHLAIQREIDYERSLNIRGEFNVTEVYGRFPDSLRRLATPPPATDDA